MSALYRILREEEIRARVTHVCDNCDMPIFPGDIYNLQVSAIRNGSYRCLRVNKEHVSPLCPPDDRDEETEFVRSPAFILALAA